MYVRSSLYYGRPQDGQHFCVDSGGVNTDGRHGSVTGGEERTGGVFRTSVASNDDTFQRNVQRAAFQEGYGSIRGFSTIKQQSIKEGTSSVSCSSGPFGGAILPRLSGPTARRDRPSHETKRFLFRAGAAFLPSHPSLGS